MKRALYAFLVSCMLALTAIGFAACGGTQKKQVTLVDWEDKTIEVDLHSDVTVDKSAVYDTEGNAYATKAEVAKMSGEAVLALDGTFRADYAGGYSIVYTLADESVSASAKTVTVKIKGTDTPAPYFKTSRLSVMENTAFSVPDRGYALDPALSVSSETLTLYRVDGEERTKVEADLTAQVTLPAGTYVFVYEVKAGEKTGNAELAFRVKIKSEQFALAALNGEGENALGVSCYRWDEANYCDVWTLGSVTYTSEVARNEYVSNGSAKIELPASNGAAYVYVTPEISQADFVVKMNKPGALVSIWLYSDAENGEPRSVKCGTKGASLPDKTWTNVKVSAEEFGFKDNPAGFWTALSMGKSALFSVNNAGSAYTLYVDSIYVTEPLTGTFENVACTYGSEVTLAAQSEQTDKFYYELFDTVDGTAAQASADGKFTPRVAGKILAKAYPCDNGYYAEAMTTVVTVTHTASLAFDKDCYEFDYGTSDRPTATVTGGEAQVQYRLDSADGSQSFSYLADGGKIRLFEGNYTLTATAKIGDVDYVTFATLTADAAPVQKGIIENYDSPESVQNTKQARVTYMGDFEGEQGVIRYDLTGDMWPGYQMNYSLQTKETLLEQGFDENDYFAIHFYIEDVPANYIILDFVFGNGQYNLRYINEGWNTAYLSAGRFLNSFDQWFAPEYSGYFFFTNNNYTGPLYVYIDWIGLVKNEHGTDVVVEEGGIEFDNFDHEHATIGVAANSTDLLVSWVSEYEGREGVMKLHTEAPYNAQPTFRGPVSRLTKEQFITKGVDASFDVFCVDVYVASDGNYTMLDGSGNTLASFNEGKKWYTVEVPVSYVLDHLDTFSFAFTDESKAHTHEIYIDRMYFKMGLGAAVEGNKLVRRADNPEYIYKFTVNGVSDNSYVIDVENGYNLLPLASDAKFSTGYTIVVTRYNSHGTAVGESATLTWSSPVGANEINGFDSSLSRSAFIGNPGLTMTFENEVSDGTTTKKGVAKIQFNDYPWPDFKIGAPMLTKEQSTQYVGENNYVVISAYFTANNMSGLKLTYRHVIETNADYTVDIQAGWNNYSIPVSYFDYDQIAAGRDFFFVARNDGALTDVVMYLDAIYLEYREPVPEFHIEDNKLTVENPNSGVAYKFTVNGGSDDGYIIDTKNGFDLMTLVTEQGVFSADYTIVVQGYNATNETVGASETLTWSSPAGANEINGFNSTAAQQAFIGNKTLTTTFEKSVSDGTTTKNGVVKIALTGEYPDLKIGVPMLSKDQSARFNGENHYVVFVVYFASERVDMSALTLTYRGKGGDKSFAYQAGWNEYWIPVSYFDYDELAKGAGSQHFFFPALSNLAGVTMYIDEIRFDYKEPVVEPETSFEIEENQLTVSNPKNGIAYKFTVNGKSDESYVIDTENGFNLTSLVANDSFSTDYAIVVQGYDGEGEAAGAAKLFTWSSPAGKNEINGFGSTAAKQAFVGNSGLTTTFEDSVSDGTTTRSGVVKIQLTEYAWPDLKIGAPMIGKEQAADFNSANHYVVFRMYFTANSFDGLKVVYRHFTGAETNEDYEFVVNTGWNEYWMPVSYFDYDGGDGNRDHFFIVRNDGALTDVVVYIDEIRFDYREPVTEIRLDENTLAIVNPKSGVTYKFTVNGNSDDGYVIGEDGFDLTTVSNGGFSADYAIVVQGYDGAGEKSGEEKSFAWSSPAGANEINGFGSKAAQKAFVGNRTLTTTFEESVSDGTTTKNGVVKIALTGEYPDLKIGVPMLTKEQAATFNNATDYVVFVVYFASETVDMTNLTLTYRGKGGDVAFKYRAGWNEYWVPASYFDYDEVAKGTDSGHFFFPALSNLAGVTMYIDEIRFDSRDYLLTDTKAVFFDFNDPNCLSSGFGTQNGGNGCTYVQSVTVSPVTNEVSSEDVTLTGIRYHETGTWPEIKGIQSAMSKSVYESFVSAGDKFVIEGYCNTNAGGNTLYYNVGGGDVAIGSLPKGGTFRFEIDAQIILDHFDDFVNGTNNVKIMFNNGNEVTHDIYFTGMYFEKVQA